MLEDCFYKGDIHKTAIRISNFVLRVDSDILNISQMWQHVYNEYAEKGDLSHIIKQKREKNELF